MVLRVVEVTLSIYYNVLKHELSNREMKGLINPDNLHNYQRYVARKIHHRKEIALNRHEG